ncbi:hypothetical protein JCM3766R1_001375 [Sporobolomyces carnicolor]
MMLLSRTGRAWGRRLAKLTAAQTMSFSGPLGAVPNRAPPQTAPLTTTTTTTAAAAAAAVNPRQHERLVEEEEDDRQLEEFFISQLSSIDSDSAALTVPNLIRQVRDKSGKVVEPNVATLPHEPIPHPNRRVDVPTRAKLLDDDENEDDDGVVVVAHVVVGRDRRTVSVSSGFAIGVPASNQIGSIVLTCCHPLDDVDRHLKESTTTPFDSATLILTSRGDTYTVDSVLSSLPNSDLVLLSLSKNPLPLSSSPSLSSLRPLETNTKEHGHHELRSLAINPYPASTETTTISTRSYVNPFVRLRRRRRLAARARDQDRDRDREWTELGRIVEYRDSIGRKLAEPGTQDEDLALFTMTTIPTQGSSGGPVVDVETGTVVGVTRGSTHKYGDRTAYGFATPAERILDMFSLPGFSLAT